MGLLNKPIGIQTISLAAVEDIVVWVILAIASAFSSGGSALQGLYTLLLTLGFIAIMVFIIRPILKWIHDYYMRQDDDTNVYLVVGCFLLLIVASFTTEVMGKFSRHEMSSRHLAINMNSSLENLKSFFSKNYSSLNVFFIKNLIFYRYTCLFWCFC
jgi:hypothetical protein